MKRSEIISEITRLDNLANKTDGQLAIAYEELKVKYLIALKLCDIEESLDAANQL